MSSFCKISLSFNSQPPEGGWRADAAADMLAAVSTHSRPKAAGFSVSKEPKRNNLFQLTAARRRLAGISCIHCSRSWFQLTAARRRLVSTGAPKTASRIWFQLTAARRRLGNRPSSPPWHSRFNSQPPEGGWASVNKVSSSISSFNSQPPEGGWLWTFSGRTVDYVVSTHSRPKAAGSEAAWLLSLKGVSTHSRPKAAGFPV